MPSAGRILLGLAVLVPLTSLGLDALFAVDVVPMTGRRTEAEVREWRRLRDPRDDPAELYGQPAPGAARRVHVWPASARDALESVPEVPGRRLLFVDEHPGVYQVDARRLHGPALGLGLLLGVLGLALERVTARRRSRQGTGSARKP